MDVSERIRELASDISSHFWPMRDSFMEMADEVAQLEAKLKAIECAECEKTLLACRCDDG